MKHTKTFTIDEAYSAIDNNINIFTDKESLCIEDSVGRFTTEDYSSDSDFPPFDRSAMDGFLVSNPNHNCYKLVGAIKAGEFLDMNIKENQAILITTGSPIVGNGKYVIKKEDALLKDGIIYVNEKPTVTNICLKGEDLKKDELVLKRSSLLTPFNIGILAMCGILKVNVFKKVKAAILITGDELINPKFKPTNSKIRDINSYSLMSLFNMIPFCEYNYYGIVPDDYDIILSKINSFVLSDENILFISAGSSIGEYDFVEDTLKYSGFKIFFNSVAVQPGKPLIFAKKDNKYVFGLPGNPVSVLISFEIFIFNALYKMFGATYSPLVFYAELKEKFVRNSSDRTLFIPVVLSIKDEKLFCENIRYNGSGNIGAYSNISHIMQVPKGTKEIKKGEKVLVRHLWQAH